MTDWHERDHERLADALTAWKAAGGKPGQGHSSGTARIERQKLGLRIQAHLQVGHRIVPKVGLTFGELLDTHDGLHEEGTTASRGSPTRLERHLEDIHGLDVIQTSPNTLHEQDHQPGHGYEGHGWEHTVDDVYTHAERGEPATSSRTASAGLRYTILPKDNPAAAHQALDAFLGGSGLHIDKEKGDG